MNVFDIIKTVRLTEKGTRQSEKYNQYTVVADRLANKTQIKQAVQELFKVKVVGISTMNVRGKVKRMGLSRGTQPSWKKAVVTLQPGEQIQVFEGV